MASAPASGPLNLLRPMRGLIIFNRAFFFVYALAILALLYRHLLTLSRCNTTLSLLIALAMLTADVVLAFMWSTTQAFRFCPVSRQEFPENLVNDDKEFPALDIFICTADPFKEPPVGVVNTALSVMAYDYPPEKISVYVSDDGGSELTLFAFMEAAKFATHWLPFCKENDILERCPEAYFDSNSPKSTWAQEIQSMYEIMKTKVENVVERGKVIDEYLITKEEREAFGRWTSDFTRQNHPTVIQVLLENKRDRDMRGHSMPNLIYLSREKNKTVPHHFKAGALNTLLRVSAVMSNAPIVLTLDCDMYSNDPATAKRVLCYFMDSSLRGELGYVQFPQHFHGLNKWDTYACENKRLFQINPLGLDGLAGPNYVGTGCFFGRRVFFGGPSNFIDSKITQLSPSHIVEKPIKSEETMELAHHVSGCNFESQTYWGSSIGFRYGSLVEDYYTGYRLQCEGWKSAFCNPQRPAFLGDTPISLYDVCNQNKRWSIGLLEVAFSKYSPITFGSNSAAGFLTSHCYSHYGFWAIWSVPITIYSFLPQLAQLNGVAIFPKVSDPWILLYAFMFLGAYGQDAIDFLMAKGTIQRWWSDQRMWLIRGLSSFLFGAIEFVTKSLGIRVHGFNVTSKMVDDEQSKRYEQGCFEFGVTSPMFVTLAIAATINLIALTGGFVRVILDGSVDQYLIQMFIAGFGVLNCLPIYGAMAFRTDKGRMPTRTTIISTLLSSSLYAVSIVLFRATPIN